MIKSQISNELSWTQSFGTSLQCAGAIFRTQCKEFLAVWFHSHWRWSKKQHLPLHWGTCLELLGDGGFFRVCFSDKNWWQQFRIWHWSDTWGSEHLISFLQVHGFSRQAICVWSSKWFFCLSVAFFLLCQEKLQEEKFCLQFSSSHSLFYL